MAGLLWEEISMMLGRDSAYYYFLKSAAIPCLGLVILTRIIIYLLNCFMTI